MRRVKNAMSTTNGIYQGQQLALASEPPHLPYCLYFSVLVNWLVEDSQEACDATLRAGTQLLSGLKAHVAKLLGSALYELLLDKDRNAD